MEDNGCKLSDAMEAPFFMSQLLSKLDPKDNTDFGRDMYRERKDENVLNLVEWLQREASIRMRGKLDQDSDIRNDRQPQRRQKVERHTASAATSKGFTPKEEKPFKP